MLETKIEKPSDELLTQNFNLIKLVLEFFFLSLSFVSFLSEVNTF